MNYWYLFFVIILLILFWISVPTNENFEITTRGYHAKIDGYGNVIYTSPQSPTANGELGCALIPCPPHVNQNLTCWSCNNYY